MFQFSRTSANLFLQQCPISCLSHFYIIAFWINLTYVSTASSILTIMVDADLRCTPGLSVPRCLLLKEKLWARSCVCSGSLAEGPLPDERWHLLLASKDISIRYNYSARRGLQTTRFLLTRLNVTHCGVWGLGFGVWGLGFG